MTGDVADGEGHSSAWKSDDIEEIAADFRSGQAFRRDVDAGRMGIGRRKDVALNLPGQLHLHLELLAPHVRSRPRRDQRERDEQTQRRRRTDDRVPSQAREWRGQAVLVQGDLNEQSNEIRPLRRLVTGATRETASAGEHAGEDVTPFNRFAGHERVSLSRASPQLVGGWRRHVTTRRNDRAVALDQSDSRELIGVVVSNVVEKDSERLAVLWTAESSRPFDIAHSLLGHASCVLKNETVRDVPVVADRLDEESDRENGPRAQEPLEPQGRPATHWTLSFRISDGL
ncbi:MAG TPA: hypothetical protein VLT86_16440 [Vicinamibacterales bacterium]|nr:hypothetical protein [Vicinamibacterales bacterium]